MTRQKIFTCKTSSYSQSTERELLKPSHVLPEAQYYIVTVSAARCNAQYSFKTTRLKTFGSQLVYFVSTEDSNKIVRNINNIEGWDSIVGIATRYRLDRPGIEPQWGRVFLHQADGSWGPPNLLYNGYWVSFPGIKQMGRGVDHPPPSSIKVKERVELLLCAPLWAFVANSRLNFTFYL